MAKITKKTGIEEIVAKHPEAVPVILESGMHCLGCAAAHFETLEDGCLAHGIDPDALVTKINAAIKAKK
jgi:hybrid cluster-associated redox disulfide protein